MTTLKQDTVSPEDFAYFVEVVEREIGIQLKDKEYLAPSRLQPIAARYGTGSISDLMQSIQLGDKKILAAAVEAMTTNETSFFREPHMFEALAKHVIPALREANRGRLTVWSAACSSGQEPYSVGMTMRERFPTVPATQTSIIATDVSPAMVAACTAGDYGRFHINRGVPAPLAIKYFHQDGRKWSVNNELRSMVNAQELNLLQPWPQIPKCDIVLLRNVMVYFDNPLKERILRRIRNDVLQPNGCLILGASETLLGLNVGFEARRLGEATFHFPTTH